MPSKKITAMTGLAGAQVPTDLVTIVDLSEPLPADQNKKSTLNDQFEVITANITAKTLIFQDALAVRSVSAVNTGKIDYNATAQSFQVSENGGAYQNLLKGSGTATRVAFWSAADELSSDAALYWDNTNKRLGVGVGTTPGAPIDVLAESVSSLAQQWRPNTGTMRAVIKLDGGPETFFGTSTPHNLHLITNDLQRLSIEDTSGNVGINKPTGIAAQLQVVANATTTVPLILNSAPTTSVNLAEIYNDAGIRFTFDNSGILTLGKVGASGATGQLTFAVNGQANTQTLRGGAAPANTNTYLWPDADPTAGQALTASAPVANVVTLSWTTIASASPGSPTNSVQFNNAGAFGGNAGFLYIPGSTTGNELALASATITSGNVFSIAATGTVAASNTKTALNVSTSGANGTASQTTYGAQFSNASTGTTATNIGADFSASGATNNYAINITAGQIKTATGSTALPSIRVGDAGLGITRVNAGQLSFVASSASQFAIVSNAMTLSGGVYLGWTATTPEAGNPDAGFVRHLANIIRAGSGTTGTANGSLLVAPSTATITGNFTVLPDNAATNTLVTVARLGVNSTGTAADGFGASLSWSAETSTTNDTETGRINVFWTTATHASRTSAISWSLTNNATLAAVMRLGTPSNNVGSPFVLTLHGGTNPNVWTTGSFAAKLYLIDATLPAVGVAAHFSATALDAPVWQMLRGRGTNASPTAAQSSDGLGAVEWAGQTSTSTNNFAIGARIRVSATENWSAGNNGCQMIFFTSNNAGTITDRMYLKETGTLRIGATSGSYDTTNLLQVGNYASFATGVTAAIYSGANGTIGMRLIGTNGQTANMLEIFRDSLTPNLLTLAASGVLSLRAGLNTGTTVAKVGGTIHEDLNPVSNASTTETDLQTYSLPANTLGTDDDYLKILVWGSFNSTVTTKRVRLYFGSTVIFDTGALAFVSSAWAIQATVVRGDATDQVTVSVFDGETALLTTTAQTNAPTETMSGAITIKTTGQGGASDQITQLGSIIQWWPASN